MNRIDGSIDGMMTIIVHSHRCIARSLSFTLLSLYLLSPHGAAATAVNQVRLEVEARLAEEKREKEAKRLAAEQRRAAVVERCCRRSKLSATMNVTLSVIRQIAAAGGGGGAASTGG